MRNVSAPVPFSFLLSHFSFQNYSPQLADLEGAPQVQSHYIAMVRATLRMRL